MVKTFCFDALMYVLILRELVLGVPCVGLGFRAPTRSGWTRFGCGEDTLMLRELDAAHQNSGEAGDCGGGFAFHWAMGEVGQEAGDSGAEIMRGDVISSEEKRQVAVGWLSGVGFGLLTGVVEAEARMAAGEWHTATATVGKGEGTQGRAVMGGSRTWVSPWSLVLGY